MTPDARIDNDVNDSIQSSERVAFGRGGNKASSVVIQRNPCKEKEKTEKVKERLKVGTWNVRTMRRPGKLTNVIGEMKKAGLKILGLSEVRWKDAGEFTDRNNQKPTEKLAGPHNERRLPSKNYNRGKNGRYKEKRKTKNDVTGLDAERGLQQVEGESWGSW